MQLHCVRDGRAFRSFAENENLSLKILRTADGGKTVSYNEGWSSHLS